MLAELTCGGWCLALAGLDSDRRKKKHFLHWKTKVSNSTWSFLLPFCCGALWFLLYLSRLCRRVDNSDGATDTSGRITSNELKMTIKPVKLSVPFLPVQRSLCGGGKDHSLLGTFSFLLFKPMNNEQSQIRIIFKDRRWNLIAHVHSLLPPNGIPVYRESDTISRSFRSARSSLSCCSSVSLSPRGITKKMS